MPANGPFVLRDLVDESQLFGCVPRHLNDESSLEILVSFGCDDLQSFAADAGTDELVVDGGLVGDRDTRRRNTYEWAVHLSFRLRERKRYFIEANLHI